jgi:cell fate regulator YaaT (PSP1 superfamily)
MGCSGCSTGRGCSTSEGGSGGCSGGCSSGGCNKLNVYDWLANMELPSGQKKFDVVEVRFKNSRKEYFRNINDLPLVVGEVVAVEGSPGHDIGIVSLTGELVKLQLKKRSISAEDPAMKKLYRKAKQADVEKWQEAQAAEQDTMIRSRQIAAGLKLNMKISDVEYQGDKAKAIFYYTAEERVDFRELIKILAEQFRVRIEMRQIGARQEASRVGGIGSCGRELCCSTWLTDFRSVTTGAARYQQLSLNPQKLAGQCGKLKCCLNYELDTYLDALKDFPDSIDLEIQKGRARHQKTDIFKAIFWYTFADEPDNFIPVPVARVKEVIAMNKNGQKPEILVAVSEQKAVEKQPDFENVVGQDSLTRFDNKNKNKKRKKKRSGGGGGNAVVRAGANPQQKTEQQQQRPKPQQQQNNQQDRNKQQDRRPQQNKPQTNPNAQQNRGPRPQNQQRRDQRDKKNQGPNTPPPISTPPPGV